MEGEIKIAPQSKTVDTDSFLNPSGEFVRHYQAKAYFFNGLFNRCF
jgi:hypothetical protein